MAGLDALMDEHVAAEVGADETTHRFGGVLDWGPDVRALIDHEPMLPILEAILGPGFRLDHDYADLIRSGKGPIGTKLHGGAVPFDPGQWYTFVEGGSPRSGLVVVAYNLRDVGPGRRRVRVRARQPQGEPAVPRGLEGARGRHARRISSGR